MNKLKIGLFGVGLEAYWGQFSGLKAQLREQIETVELRLTHPGVEVVNLGLVDSPGKAFDAGHAFRRADIDVLFLYVTTYALSSTVLPVVQRAGVPVIILNLQPEAAIDYARFNRMTNRTDMTREWLAYCSACPVPELANVLSRTGLQFHQVTGVLDADDPCWREVDQWIEAAQVANLMFHNRCGVMGHYYGGMLDIYCDLTLQCATFGGHFEFIETDELTAIAQEVDASAIRERVADFREAFDIQNGVGPEQLACSARTSVALDRLVEKYNLGSLAYYYIGSEISGNRQTISSVILGNSLLTSRGIPVAGEYEIKNVQAMKILDSLGVGGSFTEYYAIDFNDDIVLMGHDGPGHIAIAEGKTKVRALNSYHGKAGSGLSVEMSVRQGPVTLLSVVETGKGRVKLLTAQAESVSGPILEIGNTNSRYRFPISAREFVASWNAHGPAHHCAVGTGNVTQQLIKLGHLLGIEVAKVC